MADEPEKPKKKGGRKPPAPKSRARAKKAKRKSKKKGAIGRDRQAYVDARVNELIELMLDGKFHGGKTELAISKREDVAFNTVQGWASQASRFIRRAAWENQAEVKTRILAGIEALKNQAMNYERVVLHKDGKKVIKRTVEKASNFNAALKAYELQLRVYGMLRDELHVTHSEQFEGWTREELDRFAETGKIPARLKATLPEDVVEETLH